MSDLADNEETPEADAPAEAQKAAEEVPAAAPEVAAPQTAPAAAAIAATPPPAAEEPSAGAPPVDEPAEDPRVSPQIEAENKLQDLVKFHQDLSAGHIKPETYQDLFNKKDTLGKATTIFGLILSGAGSGLTHQPNVLLDMMNKEIERDLEGQKANQENKRSWYNLSLQQEKMLPENAAKWAEANVIASKADRDRWKNVQLGIQDMSSSADAANRSTAAVLNAYQDEIDKMPPGSRRDNAQYVQDNVIVPAALNKARQRLTEVAQKKTLLDAVNPAKTAGAPPPPQNKEPIPGVRYAVYNQGELARKFSLGNKLGEDAGMSSDAIPPAEQPHVLAEIPKLEANRATYADAAKSFNLLANMREAGEAPGVGVASGLVGAVSDFLHGPSTAHAGGKLENFFLKERMTQLQPLVAKMIAGGMNAEEAHSTAEAFLPSFSDSKEARQEKFEQLRNHFTSRAEEAAPLLRRYNLYNEAPKYHFKDIRKKSDSSGATPMIQPIAGKNKL